MSMMTRLLTAGAFAAVAMMGTAQAATVTQSAQPLVAIANPLADSTSGLVSENITGSVLNERRDVWEGTALAGTGVFTSIGAGASATYVFSSLRTQLNLVWGSPDDYNKIEFFNGDTLLDTVATVAILGPILPCCVTGQPNIANSLIAISNIAGVGAQFDKIVLSSSRNAFEVANIAAVPVPAAGFLLIGALGGLAALRRRKTAA